MLEYFYSENYENTMRIYYYENYVDNFTAMSTRQKRYTQNNCSFSEGSII